MGPIATASSDPISTGSVDDFSGFGGGPVRHYYGTNMALDYYYTITL